MIHFMMWTRVLLILLLTFKWRIAAVTYSPKDDTHGIRVSFNDDFAVAAFNNENNYYIRFLSTDKDIECVIPYTKPEIYVYSLSVLRKNKKSETFSFVQVSENETSNHAILSRVSFKLTNCYDSSPPTTSDEVIWTNGHQEYMKMKVDPQEKYAYVFAVSFILSYDLSTKEVQWGDPFYELDQNVIPAALDLTNEWAFVIGYTPSIRSDFGRTYLYIVELSSKTWSICNDSSETFLSFVSVQDIYKRGYGVSISISPSEKFIAIGVSAVNRVQIFETSEIKNCSFKPIGSIQPAPLLDTIGIGFGHSVAWLDSDGPLAVLVYNPKTQLRPESEIHVFKSITQNNETQHVAPDFIFPNNQQMLPKSWSSRSFLLIIAHSNNLLILCDTHRYLYIPIADAGSRPVLYDERPKSAFVLQSKPCVSGSYKNTTSIGPCSVCPPGTKNSGNYPAVRCQPCNSMSFCPLGASLDIRHNDFLLYKSYNQTFKYPESPLVDDFDDMLMRNFFVVEDTADCMLKLPLVWTLIAIAISFLMWLTMFSIKKWQPTSTSSHRKRVKMFFRQIDIIGEGEMFAGGLASIVVLTIIVHSCWFANDYLHSYSLATTNSSRLQCRNNQTNTKFDNALHLPLPEIDGSYETIFDMLNKQKFTMTIHLINTGAKCDNITVERLRLMGAPENMMKQNCTLVGQNKSGSFSFDLSTHTDSIQVTIEGPYFIGALRLCLYGEKGSDEVEEQKRHQLNELDVCTLFYTDNETIGLSTDFSIHLIKVINVTEPLKDTDETNYTGRWGPYITHADDLSDRDYFKKDGQYLRYTSVSTRFNVRLREEFYFLQNNQSPIVHLYELIFHTFLFVFLVIDIFAMMFVFYKLWCKPLLRRLLSRRCDTLKWNLQSTHTDSVVDSPSQLPETEIQLTAKDACIQLCNLDRNWATNSGEDDQHHYCTGKDVKTQVASATITQLELIPSKLSGHSPLCLTTSTTTEPLHSSNHLNIESLFEYFDKRFEAVTQNMERLISDVNTMRNQIDALIPDLIHFKQHMADIRKINKNENDDDNDDLSAQKSKQ